MSAATPADDAERRYQALAEELSVSSGVTPGQMFGMPTLKAGSKAFAGRFQDAMVFKLSGEAHGRALALSGAHLFDPSGMRPMKEWVVVPPDHADEWHGLARDALNYVRGS
jgi:hypothetical protein